MLDGISKEKKQKSFRFRFPNFLDFIDSFSSDSFSSGCLGFVRVTFDDGIGSFFGRR